jgi:CubicO group peptidase (beta-lactamase class C family)
VPTLVQLLDGSAPANSVAVRVDKVPGEAFRYSGGGMTVAQLLVNDVSGLSFAPFMKATVLDSLGMNHSCYEQPLPASMEANAATAHNSDGVPIKGRWHIHPEQAAAGLWTTPSDLALFAIELQKSRAGTSNKILSKEMTMQMLTRSTTSPFGLGIVVSGPSKVASFNHSGSNVGFRTLLFAYTETGKGAVVMTNSDFGGDVTAELMRSLAKEYGWSDYQVVEKVLAQVDVNTLAAYAGDYTIDGVRAELTIDGTHLFVKTAALGPDALEVFPESATTFFMLASPTLLNFEKNEKGSVSLEVTFQGKKIKAIRVS